MNGPPSPRWEAGEGTPSLQRTADQKSDGAKQRPRHSLSAHELRALPPGIQHWPTQALVECATIQEFIFYFVRLSNFLQPSKELE